MLSFVLCYTLFGCSSEAPAMHFCWNDFVVQIGPKLLCVNDGIGGCLARQKTQTVGR